MLQFALPLVGVGNHRAELVHRKAAAVQTAAGLPVEHGAGRGRLDQQRQDQHHGQADDQKGGADAEVVGALEQQEEEVRGRRRQRDDRPPVQVLEVDLGVGRRQQIERDAGPDALFLQAVDDVLERWQFVGRDGEEHVVDHVFRDDAQHVVHAAQHVPRGLFGAAAAGMDQADDPETPVGVVLDRFGELRRGLRCARDEHRPLVQPVPPHVARDQAQRDLLRQQQQEGEAGEQEQPGSAEAVLDQELVEPQDEDGEQREERGDRRDLEDRGPFRLQIGRPVRAVAPREDKRRPPGHQGQRQQR